MLVWALVLLIIGAVLVANPFDEQQHVVVILTGASLLVDGIGNLISIFWTGICFRRLKRMPADPYAVSTKGADIIDMEASEEDNVQKEKKKSKIVGSSTFFRKKAAKEEKEAKGNEKEDFPVYSDCEIETEEKADIQLEEFEDETESNNKETEPVAEEEAKTPDEE